MTEEPLDVVWRPGVLDPDEAHLAVAWQTVHTEPIVGHPNLVNVRWWWTVCHLMVHSEKGDHKPSRQCPKCLQWQAAQEAMTEPEEASASTQQ